MADNEKDVQQDLIEQTDAPQNGSGQLIIFVVILAFLVYWGVQHPGPALRIVLVLLGFGGIVMVHELGHFIMAKLGGIKVEAFSIGMGPIVLGIRKKKKGWGFRVLPKIGETPQVDEGDNETEYQIALFPIGGFVKMLGQSDTGAADANDDPRSYSNRPISVRIATVSAGVIFNAIGAIVIFIILFMNGINLPPAIVGDVVTNSPAYDAGIRPGDRIIEVNGNTFVDFTAVQLAPALSSSGEPILYNVQRSDGTEEQVKVIAETQAGDSSGMRYSGIVQTQVLKIDERGADDPDYVAGLNEIGFRPGDEIKAVDDQIVSSYAEFRDIVSQTFKPEVTLRVSRQWPIVSGSDQRTMETVKLPMWISATVDNFRDEYDMAQFGGLVPPLQIEEVTEPSKIERLANWFRTAILRKQATPTLNKLLNAGDILVKVGDVSYPNYKQLRELTIANENKPLLLAVQREDEQGQKVIKEVTVTPKAGPGSNKRVTIGFTAGLVVDRPVVAQVLKTAQIQSDMPDIPSGAVILTVAQQPVQDYFDIALVLQKHAGQTIEIEYQIEEKKAVASIAISEHEPVHAQAFLGVRLPLTEYTEEYLASGPVEAVGMGLKKVGQFITQNYITLAQLIKGQLPSSSLMGPVGIISVSYQAAGYDLDRYLYFLGLISTCLAVMNLLPLPVLDGGHIIFLLIEKITGKPIHEKVLAPIMYVGLALLLGLILWVSYNDILRLLFGS